ncbi:hypothetical protein BDF22DRAFT_743180 [Syncephalis plumigaleata]|nr:hypothetical protein BDF22DRAFT_743180 [Syncephalis plumigaleata]
MVLFYNNNNNRAKIKETSTEEQRQKKKERELARIAEYCQLKEKACQRKESGIFDEEALAMTTRLLHWHPDFYTMWNYRRQILQHQFDETKKDSKQATCESELRLVEELVRKQPKSYWIWNHRRWILETMPQANWQRELGLTGLMLIWINFSLVHGWQYRHEVIRQLRKENPEQDLTLVRNELAYTKQKISQSFSNGSAWHYRGKLLPLVLQTTEDIDTQMALIKEEFDMVQSAFYTDPEDQSAWIYYRWWIQYLYEQSSLPGLHGIELLRREANVIRELLDIEPEAKWPLLTLQHLLREIQLHKAATSEEVEEAKKVLNTLIQVDPMRIHRYQHLLAMTTNVKKQKHKVMK